MCNTQSIDRVMRVLFVLGKPLPASLSLSSQPHTHHHRSSFIYLSAIYYLTLIHPFFIPTGRDSSADGRHRRRQTMTLFKVGESGYGDTLMGSGFRW